MSKDYQYYNTGKKVMEDLLRSITKTLGNVIKNATESIFRFSDAEYIRAIHSLIAKITVE